MKKTIPVLAPSSLLGAAPARRLVLLDSGYHKPNRE